MGRPSIRNSITFVPWNRDEMFIFWLPSFSMRVCIIPTTGRPIFCQLHAPLLQELRFQRLAGPGVSCEIRTHFISMASLLSSHFGLWCGNAPNPSQQLLGVSFVEAFWSNSLGPCTVCFAASR